MVRPVVDHVAALTQAAQVLETVIARIVIEVGSGQNDAGLTHASRLFDIGSAGRTAMVIAPGLTSLVVPAAIRQTGDDHAMWTPAALADAASTFESHMPAQLWPVDRIIPAHLSFDRHSTPAHSGGLLPSKR